MFMLYVTKIVFALAHCKKAQHKNEFLCSKKAYLSFLIVTFRYFNRFKITVLIRTVHMKTDAGLSRTLV